MEICQVDDFPGNFGGGRRAQRYFGTLTAGQFPKTEQHPLLPPGLRPPPPGLPTESTKPHTMLTGGHIDSRRRRRRGAPVGSRRSETKRWQPPQGTHHNSSTLGRHTLPQTVGGGAEMGEQPDGGPGNSKGNLKPDNIYLKFTLRFHSFPPKFL